MTLPRAPSVLVGPAAGLLASLWLGTSAAEALGVVQAVAVLGSAIVAMLATAMGGLMMSDWQADMQSRRDWAQLGLTPAELSSPIQVRTAYQNSTDNEALRAIFRAHRTGVHAVVRDASAAPLTSEHAGHGQELSQDGAHHHALSRSTAESKVRLLRATFHVKHHAIPARLVVNGLSWQGPVAYELNMPNRVALFAGRTAEIITLGNSEDVEAQRLSTARGLIDPTAEAPSCRGPPPLKQRRSRRGAITAIERAGAGSSVLRDGDPRVRDDLGQPVPVCATELDVIETYLGDTLDELFASSKPSAGTERA